MKKSIKDKHVLLRVDFNVPLKEGKIADDFRLRMEVDTMRDLLEAGARHVSILTHLEQDGEIPHLDPVREWLEKILRTPIQFLRGEIPATIRPARQIILFDNLRLNPGEKANNPEFARHLASQGDFYINDAFSASHRKHASIVGVPKLLPSALGPQMEREVRELSRAFSPQHPFLLILGGKKFATKAPLVERFLALADSVFIGGAIANTFLHKLGLPTGASLVEDVTIPDELLKNSKIILPQDVVVERGAGRFTVPAKDVQAGDLIYDAGPETLRNLTEVMRKARFILWNGTLGLCEKGYEAGTRALIQEFGALGAYRIAGGGDTAAAIRNLQRESNFDFISTGGGAMLEFLAQGTLPGIEAIRPR